MGSVTKDCDRRLGSLRTPIVVQALLDHWINITFSTSSLGTAIETIDKLFDGLYILSVSRINLCLQMRFRRTSACHRVLAARSHALKSASTQLGH
jgi:hypothetical protein